MRLNRLRHSFLCQRGHAQLLLSFSVFSQKKERKERGRRRKRKRKKGVVHIPAYDTALANTLLFDQRDKRESTVKKQ